MFPTEISTLEVSRNSLTTTTLLMTENDGNSSRNSSGGDSTSNHSSLSPSIHLYDKPMVMSSTTAATTIGITRTLSEGELSAYSAVSYVRDTMASARQTRESLRKSRVSLQALRRDAEKTLQEARALRREMQQMMSSSRRTATYDSDLDSDEVSFLVDDDDDDESCP